MSIFAPHHGHSICDTGFAHEKKAVRQRAKKDLRPARSGEDLLHIFGTIKNHTAETMENENDLSFTRVTTMSGIQKHYHFNFANEDMIFMYRLACDQQPLLVYQVKKEANSDGVRKVVNVTQLYKQ